MNLKDYACDPRRVYQDLIALSNEPGAPVRYDFHPSPVPSLHMTNHGDPVSISVREFEVISSTVAKYQFKAGFEVATAFGISALAAALAMKPHGGKLVTMDAYVEEQRSSWDWYRGRDPQTYQDADGWKSVQFLRDRLDLAETLYPVVGWSPADTAIQIRETLGPDAKLDYAMVDAGHWDAALEDDMNAIIPLIDKSGPWVIFVHDSIAFLQTTLERISNRLESELKPLHSCTRPEGYAMRYWGSIKAIEPPIIRDDFPFGRDKTPTYMGR